MAMCAVCGHANRTGARFCDECGASLVLAETAAERRKLATLLFCDVSGSTAMGERLDPEAVRDVMSTYFHSMRAAIERHGGTVEKFIGDAVMAVFGIPIAHEDDALRAVRAASEMQATVRDLNVDLEARFGSPIAIRIGVNSGEVVAGDPTARETLVTGDAVNVAARLEASAAPGEVLIGEPTYRLVHDAVVVEPVEPLALKGKSGLMSAYRLVRVIPTVAGLARRLETPMVGRRSELEWLIGRVETATRERRCILETVLGEPGVGKSRLAAELVAQTAGETTILRGRCLEYGDGITYWAIGEVVRQAAGVLDEHSAAEAVERIEACLASETDADVIAGRIAQSIGLAAGSASTDEIADAVGRLLAAVAQPRPVVLIVDDIHWAEAVLLDLLGALPRSLHGVPVFVLCLARPDLMEQRPAWEASVRLQPLDATESTSLVNQLLGEPALPTGLAARVASAASGNPLFVQELVGMLVDDGLIQRRNGGWAATTDLAGIAIPDTLRELLGARLDRLPADERSALERGVVEGQVFHRGAVVELTDAPARDLVPTALQRLVEREYIGPVETILVDEGAFRVRHVLIRDAAYDAIAKKQRADLHERFAGWLEHRVRERLTEYEEILGYHLEQAYRYRAEMGPVDATATSLAARASTLLERAGRRALDRRDSRACVNLLSRAAELLPHSSPRRLELLLYVTEELGFMMEVERSLTTGLEVVEGATAVGDTRLTGRARLFVALMRFWGEAEFGAEELLAEIDDVGGSAAHHGDEAVVARAHDFRAFAYIQLGRFEAGQRETEEAMEAFSRLADRRSASEQQWYLGWVAASGPMPVDEAIELCRRVIDESGDDAGVAGHTRYSLARLEAKRGCFEVARDLADEALAIFEPTGMAFAAWHPLCRGEIDILAGDASAAERHLREAMSVLEAIVDFPSLSNAASLLANLLVDAGDLTEAEALALRAKELAPKDQPIQHARWRSALARVLVRRGDSSGVALAREAVDLSRRTDFLELQADCLIALADVLQTSGHGLEVAAHMHEALFLYERKGNLPAASRLREALAESTAD